ncbi:hypothetical protein QBC41DRAFT_306738 [Cercophora samala]|uniref:Uncharacterized protein n=1 Tax=Cercophora samala TaxID=330535 RepID=A0AA40D5I2_9PEZI|nr:hypothetical protein QBC41DRAFT_306738 [Cercophora samala]
MSSPLQQQHSSDHTAAHQNPAGLMSDWPSPSQPSRAKPGMPSRGSGATVNLDSLAGFGLDLDETVIKSKGFADAHLPAVGDMKQDRSSTTTMERKSEDGLDN